MQKIRKYSLLALTALLFSCSTATKTVSKDPKLYEVLTEQPTGGANIRFFEILSEPREIAMLQNDEHLKSKITDEDVKTSNFLILNLGEKPTGGYGITVENVEETSDKIIVTIQEKIPAADAMVTQAVTYPYAIVRINSKKEIVVK